MTKYVRGQKYFIKVKVGNYRRLPKHVPLNDREIKDLLYAEKNIPVSPEFLKSELKRLGYDHERADKIVDNIPLGYILDTNNLDG